MSEEKILFEMRISEDGARADFYESPEWQAYHAPRREHGPLAWDACWGLFKWFRQQRAAASRSRKDEVRRALESLQGIYDDLYGHSAGSEA
jgi:hypothetical protein